VNTSIRTALAVALATALYVPLAQALTLVDTQANGATVNTSFSTTDTIAADLDFPTAGQVTLAFALDAGDITRGTALFNGIVNNLSSTALASLQVSVNRGTLTPGSVLSNDGSSVLSRPSANTVDISFTTPLTTFVELGDPLLQGRQDWTVGFAGLATGDTITVTWTAAPVPEPGTWALLAGGLGLLGVQARHTRRRGG
jgi:hypothetical protein